MLIAGQRIGDYQVERLIGQGAMGAVYEGIDLYIGRRVAIKILLPAFSLNPDFANRFLNEARAIGQVDHPGLVRIYQYGRLEDSTAYIVMEYLEGRPLRHLYGPAAAQTWPDTLPLLRQVAQALAAVHRKGIIHRDLKPDNVVVVADPDLPGGERAKVVDFGIAKLLTAPDGPGLQTRSGQIMGTPAYMSPEQCMGKKDVTGKADVYALGVMLYELLAGLLPFHTEHLHELIAMHLNAPPPPLRERAPMVPTELAALAQAMLSKDPAQRPDMAEVAAHLGRIGGVQSAARAPRRTHHDDGARATPETLAPAVMETWPAPLRAPRRAVLLAGLVAAVTAGGVVIMWRTPGPPAVSGPDLRAVSVASTDGGADASVVELVAKPLPVDLGSSPPPRDMRERDMRRSKSNKSNKRRPEELFPEIFKDDDDKAKEP